MRLREALLWVLLSYNMISLSGCPYDTVLSSTICLEYTLKDNTHLRQNRPKNVLTNLPQKPRQRIPHQTDTHNA